MPVPVPEPLATQANNCHDISPPFPNKKIKMTINTVFLLAAIISAIPATTYTHPANSHQFKLTSNPIIMTLEMLNYISKLVNISAITIENQYSRIKQKNKNKIMHAINGNKFSKVKIKSHLKIAQINKGNSAFKSKLNNVLELIERERPDILMVSEANMEEDAPCIKNHLKGYNVKLKLLGTLKIARMIVLIKSDITYERLYRYENDTNSMMLFKIKNTNRNFINLICVYRQWKLLHVDDSSSNLPTKQLKRLEKIIEAITGVINEGRETLLIGDVNIDLWPPNNPGQRSDIKALYELYTSVMNKLSMCQQNFKPTRFQSNTSPSLLDHVFSTHPQKINSVETRMSIIADHCLIKIQYHARTLRQRPQFKRIRDHKLVTREILMEHVGSNSRLQNIFASSDPDYIAETIVSEMNRILEEISPSKVIQCTKSYEPWKTRDTTEIQRITEKQLEHAIETSDIEEWRLFQSMRNQANKFLEFTKRTFYIERFARAGNVWKEFRQFQGQEENKSPIKIINDGKEVTSPKKLCTIFNDFFIHKIETIQSKFNPNDDEQMQILEKLIDKPTSTLELESITVDEMYKAINRMKTSTSCGFDQISSKTIKLIPEMTSLWLTHLLNNMLRTGIFPKILKISKITPIRKPNKPMTMKESYRPICNLQVFEKCIEEVLKEKITTYLEDNNILAEEQHGGRRHHSTATAKATIEEAARRNLDRNKLGLIVSTDLTAAFDSVDNSLMIKKLEFYGLRGRLLMLLKSYLTNRFQYTEIQNIQSKIKRSPSCSVIQGSKMSGMLYSLYTNEVGKLHKLLEDKEWVEEQLKVRHEEYNAEHTVVNFVDDSNSLISFGDPTHANHYLDRYFRILILYYRQNKLLLNPEKTNVMIVARPATKREADDIRIVTDTEEVKPKQTIKVLGWEMCENLTMDIHLNKVIGKVKNLMARAEEFKNYMTEKQRLRFANAYMVSSLRYGVQFLAGQNNKTRAKYHAATMLVARWVKQDFCFKVSCLKICKSLKWSLPSQQILQEAAKFAHSVQTNRRPLQIARKIRMPRTRSKAKPAMKYRRRNDKYDANLISKSLRIYNTIPESIKKEICQANQDHMDN